LVLGSGPRARRLRHRHPRGAGPGRHARQEGAIARTPKTETKTPAAKVAAPKAKAAAPKAKAAAPKAKVAAPKAKVAATKAKAATPKAKAAAPMAKAAAKPAKAAPKPAAPRPARTKKREKLAPDRLALLVDAAMKSLEDDKAENIVLLDVTGRADYADRLIIATGQVERQLQSMATHLDEALGKAGLQLRRDSIQASGDWVLIDAGDLVIHLFRPEARELYRLERMWGPESPGAADAPPG
jgi:ribosome silencing factor RsfS/YbeB/iojap